MRNKKVFIGAFCIAASLIFGVYSFYNKEIGAVKGPELDRIIINDEIYHINYNLGFSVKDKGEFWGIVTAGNKIKCRVYKVKGDKEGRYLYRLWDWEGAFYEKAK